MKKFQSLLFALLMTIGFVSCNKDNDDELAKELSSIQHHSKEKKIWLFTERLFQLIQKEKMKSIDKTELKREIERSIDQNQFNLYRLAEAYKIR